MVAFFRDFLADTWSFIRDIWHFSLFTFGGVEFTVKTVAVILLAVWALFFTSRKFAKILSDGALAHREVDSGVRYSLAALFRYIYLAIGLIAIVQTMGVNLTALSAILGFLSVGIGFGLQNVTNNLVSGIIIMVERPIKIGDRVEVGNLTGIVQKIAIRATTIVTNDNLAIIVPNSEFISSKVINWSHVGKAVWFKISVSADRNDDPGRITNVLLGVANEHPGVCKDPAPSVSFDKFSENALEFSLLVATETYLNRPGQLRSELNYAIYEAFRKNNIEIPYPKQEIHIKTSGR
ncbi:mechanosensitive ion channel [Ignavibacteria bacterium]|nr:mechanosensitive ion channel [Bacteroidota bacterium]MCZ2132577.1 mechanosensitive ion channel [Bacteroidota bacterium]